MTREMRPSQPASLLQTALIKLIKLIKTVRFYPPEHPTLRQVGEEALASFRPLLQNGNLALTVRKDRILYQDTVIGQDNAAIRSLAHYLFARRIQQLLLLPDLNLVDLTAFSRNLALNPADIRQRGGLQELLLTEQATGIWINELDLAVIQATRERLRQQAENISVGSDEKPEKGDGNDRQTYNREGVNTETSGNAPLDEHLLDQLSLEQLLAQLPKESSERRFTQLLDRLPGLVQQHLASPHLPLVLQTFQVLASLLGDQQISNTRRGEVIRCLNRLAGPELFEFLISSMCSRGEPKSLRNRTMQTLIFLRDRSLDRLIRRLAEEKDALARKMLSTTLVKLGPLAIPGLLPALQDERWYVVRNIIAILGQIDAQHLVAHLQPLLWHEDLRIARETIRALARLGGNQAVEALLQLVDKGQRELYPQAVIALGIMRHPAAVPSLVKIIKTRDPFMKQIELKTSAITALGRIGSPEAAPALERLVRRRVPWGSSRRTTLRIHAIAALAQIGCPSSRPILESLTRQRDRRVAQSALRTLQQWPES